MFRRAPSMLLLAAAKGKTTGTAAVTTAPKSSTAENAPPQMQLNALRERHAQMLWFTDKTRNRRYIPKGFPSKKAAAEFKETRYATQLARFLSSRRATGPLLFYRSEECKKMIQEATKAQPKKRHPCGEMWAKLSEKEKNRWHEKAKTSPNIAVRLREPKLRARRTTAPTAYQVFYGELIRDPRFLALPRFIRFKMISILWRKQKAKLEQVSASKKLSV